MSTAPTPAPTPPPPPTQPIVVVAGPDGTVQTMLGPSYSQPGHHHRVSVSPAGGVRGDCSDGMTVHRCQHRRLAVEACLMAAGALVNRQRGRWTQAQGWPPAPSATAH
jgi:hypothetical protein